MFNSNLQNFGSGSSPLRRVSGYQNRADVALHQRNGIWIVGVVFEPSQPPPLINCSRASFSHRLL
jgi:hypothetical protein